VITIVTDSIVFLVSVGTAASADWLSPISEAEGANAVGYLTVTRKPLSFHQTKKNRDVNHQLLVEGRHDSVYKKCTGEAKAGMFTYYLNLGVRSLSRNIVITSLMILLIAIGVAGSITTYALLRVLSANPLPLKSHQLYVPQIDNRGPNRITTGGEPDPELTFHDVVALRANHEAVGQAAIYPIYLSAVPTDIDIQPVAARGYAVTADFFRMFLVPFEFGGAWSKADDDDGGNTVVIGKDLNEKLFRGENSVGRELPLEGHTYRIAGVMKQWNPLPRFYAAADVQAFDLPPQIFLPFRRAIDLKIPTAGSTFCALNYQGKGWDDLVRSECTWISFWVELPDPTSARRYAAFLSAYAKEQNANGRFNWPAYTRLRDLDQWLNYLNIVPSEVRISFIVALGLLLVCAVNTVGLLLARFLRRGPDIGIRRALGASRAAIYRQYLVEAAVLGLAGGLVGVLFTVCFIGNLDLVFEAKIVRTVHADAGTMALAISLSVLVALIAAAYPVWRASRIQPAWQLKIG
jgi:putative ABC transport system permease protein